MDLKEGSTSENWTKSSTYRDEMQCQSLPAFGSQQQQNWEDPSTLDYSMRIHPSLSKFIEPSENPCLLNGGYPNNQPKSTNQEDIQKNQMLGNDVTRNWDPRAMLSNLSILEQKIHQLQKLIHMIVGRTNQVSGNQDELVTQQQQLITADLTSIIVQLISTAGGLLPSVKNNISTASPSNTILFPSATNADTSMKSQTGGGQVQQSTCDPKSFERSNQVDRVTNCATEINYHNMDEEHELKDDDDGREEEHLPPGSYEILQMEKEEILAPHTHFCTICGKGFKRDANLRMHMRGHGDEYKTPAALAKPNKESSLEQVLLKRYSCPYVGCKRNKDHKKFQPLKTILCVKNHYKRTHCDKSYICSRCHTKKFSVMADLKTHEKHCGRDKWLCSCGTTFSRKDKLFGHIALFQGHTPAIPVEENKTSGGMPNPSDVGEPCNNNKGVNVGFTFGCDDAENRNCIESMMDGKGNVEDPYYSLLNNDCSLGGFQDFSQANFDDSSSSFSFLISGGKGVMQSGISDMN